MVTDQMKEKKYLLETNAHYFQSLQNENVNIFHSTPGALVVQYLIFILCTGTQEFYYNGDTNINKWEPCISFTWLHSKISAMKGPVCEQRRICRLTMKRKCIHIDWNWQRLQWKWNRHEFHWRVASQFFIAT